MSRTLFCLLVISFLLSPASVFGAEGDHVLVVCPKYFRESLQPWIEYRTAQGYTIHVLTEPQIRDIPGKNATGYYTSPAIIKKEIQKISEKIPLKSLLIIGGARSNEDTPIDRAIPSPLVKARIIQNFGESDHIASDNFYADLNDDDVPELAVGRFPVGTCEELDAVVRKMIKYEKMPKNGECLRRLNFVAGVGGFSMIIDSTIESMTGYILNEMIPAGFDLRMTQASWKCAYCPDPFQFRAETINRMNEGSLFWVYIGHGHRTCLDAVHTPEGDFPIYLKGDERYVKCENAPPIVVFLACHTGAIDQNERSISESLFVKEDGPVAVIAASRTTMPYAMTVFGVELIEELFQNCPQSLGALLLQAKRKMAEEKKAPLERVSFSGAKTPQRPLRETVDALAKLLDPTADKLPEQRIDHLHLFHLFGDPLLKLPTPRELALDCPREARRGENVRISGKSALETADVTVELTIPRIRQAIPSPKRPKCVLDEAACAEYQATYRKANQRVLSYVQAKTTDGGKFEVLLPIPKDATGEQTIRVFLQGTEEYAIGSTDITIK